MRCFREFKPVHQAHLGLASSVPFFYFQLIMAFSSNSSKAKARATVSSLFESLLPESAPSGSHRENRSATQAFNREISKHNPSTQAVKKAKKISNAKKNKRLNKILEKDKKFAKIVKYNVIKAHKLSHNLSEEEAKYLRKLAKKNASSVRRITGYDEPEMKEEIDELQNEILKLSDEAHTRSTAYLQNSKLKSFNEKVKSGAMSYPGLTPGLAPVGYDDDSD